MKRTILFLMIVSLSLFLVVTTVGASEDLPRPRIVKDGSFKLGFLLPELTNESSKRHWRQVQIEVEHRGWELIHNTNATYESSKTREAFRRIMDQNPDAILFSYLDVAPIRDLVVEAREKGIGVYNVGTDLIPGILLSTKSSNPVIAAKIMDYAIQRMEGKGKVSGFLDLWMPRGERRDIVAATLIEEGGWDFGETIHYQLTPEGYTDEIFEVTSNWITKYGNDLDFVWVCWDLGAITAARAMAAAGYTDPDDMFTVGIDGGSHPWAIIRNGDIPFVASLAEPFEMELHKTIEAIKQIQIEGMMPGDSGCIAPANNYLSMDKYTVVVDESNVPEPGTNIHEVFNYYNQDPNDQDAWYNWGEAYKVKANI